MTTLTGERRSPRRGDGPACRIPPAGCETWLRSWSASPRSGCCSASALPTVTDAFGAWAGVLPIYGGSAHLAVLGSLDDGVDSWSRPRRGCSSTCGSWSIAAHWPRCGRGADGGTGPRGGDGHRPTWVVAERRAARPGTLVGRRGSLRGCGTLLTVGWLGLSRRSAGGVVAGGCRRTGSCPSALSPSTRWYLTCPTVLERRRSGCRRCRFVRHQPSFRCRTAARPWQLRESRA